MKVIFSKEVSFSEWQAVQRLGDLNYNLTVWKFQNCLTGEEGVGIFSKGKQRFFDRENYTLLLEKFLRYKGYDHLFREAYR